MEAEAIEAAVRRWGRTACAFDVLDATARYRFFASQQVPGALVPFKVVGSVDAVIGEPLAPEDGLAATTREFIASRRAIGRRVVGFCASEAFARAIVEAGGAAAQITAEPEIDPLTYEPSGGSAKKLRVYARRLERAGVRGTALWPGEVESRPEFRNAAEALVQSWKARARNTAAHILDLDPWNRAAEKRYFAVFDPKDADRMWSLLIAHPVYGQEGGWHLCHLMRSPDAPKGVNEVAVLTAIEALGDAGSRYATFGPYPVAQAGDFLGLTPRAERVVRWAYHIAADRIGYGSSIEFYRKIQAGPWQPRYLAIWPRRALVRGFYAMTRLANVYGFLEGRSR